MASSSRGFQFWSPLSPLTSLSLPSVMVHLSQFFSEETLYSKVRWVSPVKVSCSVLVLELLPLLPDMRTVSPPSVVTFHFLVLLGLPGSVSAMTGRPSK